MLVNVGERLEVGDAAILFDILHEMRLKQNLDMPNCSTPRLLCRGYDSVMVTLHCS